MDASFAIGIVAPTAVARRLVIIVMLIAGRRALAKGTGICT